MIINSDALESYRDVMEEEADAFIAEILDGFYSNSRDLMATLDESLAADDVNTFIRAAHTLKSTAATVGAERLSDLAADLEGRAGFDTLSELAPTVETLKKAFAEAEAKLKELYP